MVTKELQLYKRRRRKRKIGRSELLKERKTEDEGRGLEQLLQRDREQL